MENSQRETHENSDSKNKNNLDRIMLGTLGIGLLGESLYYFATGDTLPEGVWTGFYRGFFEAGPVYILAGTRLLSHIFSKIGENVEV